MACPENLTFSIVQILWRWWAGILYHYKVRWWFSCSKLAIGLKSVTSFRNVLTSCLSGWSLVAIIWLWADDCWMVIVSWWSLNGDCELMIAEWWLWADDCWMVIVSWWLLNGDCELMIAEWWLWADDCWMVIVSWWLLNGDCELMIAEWWLWADDCWMVIVSWWLLNGDCELMIAEWWLWADDCWMVIVSWWSLNGGSRLSCPETVTVRLQTSDPHWMCYLLPCRSISQRMKEGMAIYNAPVYKNFSAKIYIMHVPSAGIWKKIKLKKACIFAHTL